MASPIVASLATTSCNSEITSVEMGDHHENERKREIERKRKREREREKEKERKKDRKEMIVNRWWCC